MKYIIKCNRCKKEFAIDDPEFTALVNEIEDRVGEMVSILHRNKVNVSYKSHNHILPILEVVMRCCDAPDIDFYIIEDDAWAVLSEGADNYFSGDRDENNNNG